jgi:hypothetical protein
VNGTIAAVMVALVAGLAAIGLLTGGDSSAPKPAAPRARAGPSIRQIALEVEQVRQLRFKELPPVRRVTNAQARADALHELDEELPPSELAQAERLLKLLRLIPADASLRRLMGKAFGSEVGGYYVPRTGKLSVVGGGGGLLREVTLAHELTHALEDQHFDLDRKSSSGLLDDRSAADSAVREGSATVVMVDYVILKQTGQLKAPEALRQRVLSALDDAAVPPSSGLPRYLRDSLVFPYPAGARLIDRTQQRGGWAAVNRLYAADAPVSSEQVMHPAKRHDPPLRVRIPSAGAAQMHGDFGEFDTRELLLGANTAAAASRAAAGWGGGAFALFRDRLAMSWTWDTPRDAAEFWSALRRTARDLHGTASRAGAQITLTIRR